MTFYVTGDDTLTFYTKLPNLENGDLTLATSRFFINIYIHIDIGGIIDGAHNIQKKRKTLIFTFFIGFL